MKVIAQRTRILGVSKDWDERFPPDGTRHGDKEEREIGDKLRALDLTKATADDIKGVIGKDDIYWIIPFCDECGQRVDAVAQIGEDLDDDPYERADTAWLCRPCLMKAVNEIDKQMLLDASHARRRDAEAV